jgi:hypothetical protein
VVHVLTKSIIRYYLILFFYWDIGSRACRCIVYIGYANAISSALKASGITLLLRGRAKEDTTKIRLNVNAFLDP